MSPITNWFDNISLKVKFLFCVCIPVSLVLVVSTTVYQNTQSLLSDNAWVNHTHKAIGRAEELLGLIDKMEYGHRGAVLTDDNSFFERFTFALAAWPNKVATLANQVDDNPPQVERLAYVDRLHKQWLSMVSDKVSHPTKLTNSSLSFMEHIPKQPTDDSYKDIKREIKSELMKFIRVEKKLIYKRINASKDSAERTTYTLIFGSLFIIFISSLIAIMAAHRVNKRLRVLLMATNEMKEMRLTRGVSMLENKAYFRSKDEISKLTKAFYSLAQNLDASHKEMERKNQHLEEEKQKAEAATRAKSDFLSTMSHEIRTPMNGVLGIAQIINDETKEASTKENATIILESGQHLMAILNDILDYSKIEENKLVLESDYFDAEQMLTPVVRPLSQLAEEKNIHLHTHNKVPSNTLLLGDKSRLTQILFNLTGNAVKFTSEGNVIIDLHLNKVRNQLVISVIDSGIGIAKEKQENIFKSFEQADTSTTRKFGGTGLGLAIVSKLVALMNGHIDLESKEGEGSTFTITLPTEWKEQQIASDSSDSSDSSKEFIPSQQNYPKLHVLIVDDNKVNGIVARNFCTKLGFTVKLAENGRVAITMLAEEVFDLVIMDNHMPEMNGIECTQYIRDKLSREVLIFAYTADVFDEPHKAFLRAGANTVLTKPLQEQSFLDALHTSLSKQKKTKQPATPNSNVTPIVRKPIRQNKVTEEELSSSSTLQAMEEDFSGLMAIVETLVNDFRNLIPTLVEKHEAGDLAALHKPLHTVKGMAMSLQMENLAQLALDLESKALNQTPIETEMLQKLINLMLINISEGESIIRRLSHKIAQNKGAS